MKISIVLLGLIFSLSAAEASDCSYENLNVIAQAMIKTPKLGQCKFRKVVITQDPSASCSGALSFEINDSDSGSTYKKVTIDTTSFKDRTIEEKIDMEYNFDRTVIDLDHLGGLDKTTLFSIDYVMYLDHTQYFNISDYSFDPSYPNSVNSICSDIY